jgi:hypothetical protein
MLGAVNFLKQYYEKIYLLCKDIYKSNVEKLVPEGVLLIPFNSKKEKKECANIINSADTETDIFISGFCHTSYLKSRITHPELIIYKKDDKTYSCEYQHIKDFYNDISLDLSIYYEFFEIKSSSKSRSLLSLIENYKIVFVHTKASNVEINIDSVLSEYILDQEYIVICANKNVYNKENCLYEKADHFINIPIAYYIDVIKNAIKIHVIDSCFSCIILPLKKTNRLLANEIIFYNR